jgi:hypothetical protein
MTAAKAFYDEIYSIHVYSLSPSPIHVSKFRLVIRCSILFSLLKNRMLDWYAPQLNTSETWIKMRESTWLAKLVE